MSMLSREGSLSEVDGTGALDVAVTLPDSEIQV